MISSTHNHSTGSDGKLTPEEVIKKAIQLGWKEICFTDHYKAPEEFPNKYYQKLFNENYIAEVKDLRKKYSDKINVLFGVEFNWLADFPDWTKKELSKEKYDYIMGSVHEIIYNNQSLSIENGKETWLKYANEFGGIKEFVCEYYNQIKSMIKSGFFDSVAHLDYIRIYNNDNCLFNEQDSWYKKEVVDVLDLIKEKGLALEVNHGGIRKTGEQFPRSWVISEAKAREVPITLGLDAHYPNNYSNEFMQELINIAKRAGYNEVVRFVKRKMVRETI